jgi:hypothetical protein
MLTPKLEELILCGKAFFKTAVVGGNKSTINIENDRFIIITDITYLPYINSATVQNINADLNMQLSIYGERGFNHYIFANARTYGTIYYDVANSQEVESNDKMPMLPQKIDCYLLHTTQVGFSFILSPQTMIPTNGVASFNNPAFEPPLDYGKDGMAGALNVATDLTPTAGFLNQIVNRGAGLAVGSNVTQQIQYPANVINTPETAIASLAIANINYVEILGQPNNIGI